MNGGTESERPTAAQNVRAYLPQRLIGLLPFGVESPALFQLPAAVMFADISGFTPLTERLVQAGAIGVDRLGNLLNAFYSELVGLIESHEGELITIIGDGVVSIWPADPSDMRSAALQAQACADEILRTLHDYRPEPQTRLRLRLSLGVGMTSVIRVGCGKHWELALAGDAVAQVFEANHKAQPGRLGLSSQARALLGRNSRSSLPPSGEARRSSHPPSGDSTRPSAISSIPPPSESSDLLKYLPTALQSRMQPGASPWLAELRHVSVVFVRLSSIERESTDLDALQRAVSAIHAVTERYEGMFDKLVFDDKGTIVTIAFGLPPNSHENDPRRAVRSALDLKTRLEAEGIHCDLGVSSGRAFCGSLGRTTRMQYCVVGRVMNVAARLMEQASGSVLCCYSTYLAVREHVQFQALAPLTLKGFSEPVAAFRPQAGPALIQPPLPTLFGRESERAQLSAAVAVRGSLTWMEAEAGLGKSALLADLRRACRERGQPILFAIGDAIETGTPYHAWRKLFCGLLSVGEADLRDAGALLQRLAAVAPESSGLAPLLNPILRARLPESSQTERLLGQARADRTHDLLLELLSRGYPNGFVLAIDDLHWFDSASLRLLVALRRRMPELPLVVATRPFSGPLPDLHRLLRDSASVRRIVLQPISPEAVRGIIADRLGARAGNEAAELVFASSEGNPFFAQSFTLMLAESGALVVSDREVRLSNPGGLSDADVPSSLEAVISGRLDRLPLNEDLITLKTASVIGRSFELDVLRAIHPAQPSPDELRGSLTGLVQHGLLLAGDRDGSYAFDHTLTHAVTYGRMPYGLRRNLHEQLTRYYERRHAGQLDGLYPLLAHHYERAGRGADACDALEHAAGQALRAGAFQEAVAFLQRALQLAGDSQAGVRASALRRARWHRQLAEALDGAGNKAAIGEHARAALALIGRPVPRGRLRRVLELGADTLRQLRTAALQPERPQLSATSLEALEVVRSHQALAAHSFYAQDALGMAHSVLRATNEAEPAQLSAESSKSYSGMGLMLGVLGQHRLAEHYIRRALEGCRELPDLPTASRIYVLIALYHVGAGRFADCAAEVLASQRLADECDDHVAWAEAQAIRIWSHVYRAQNDEATSGIEALAARVKRTTNVHLEAWAQRFEASQQLRRGNAPRAVELFQTVLPVVSQQGDKPEKLLVHGSLALAQWQAGMFGAAERSVEQALQLLASTPRQTSHIVFHGLCDLLETLGELRVRRPSPELETRYDQVLAALARFSRSFPIGQARCAHYQGLRQLDQRRLRAARASWSQGFALAERLALPVERALLAHDLTRL